MTSNEEISLNEKFALFQKGLDSSSESALYEDFYYILDSLNNASLDEQKSFFNKLAFIDLKYLDRAIESHNTKDEFHREDFVELTAVIFIDFFKGYKSYLALKNTKELTVEVAKAFADIANYDHASFYRLVKKIPELKELYISTAKWLIEHGEYDCLVYLMDFEPECQMNGPSYTASLWNNNRKKPLLNRIAYLYPGCQKGSILCCLRYFGCVEQAFPDYSKRSERDRKRDVEVYLKLKDYYKKEPEKRSYKETIEYLKYLLWDVATLNDIADYDEFHKVLMKNLNNNREDFINAFYSPRELTGSVYKACYGFANNPRVKDRQKCKDCLVFIVYLYKNKEFSDLGETSMKGVCFEEDERSALYLPFEDKIVDRFVLLKNEEFDKFLDLIKW